MVIVDTGAVQVDGGVGILEILKLLKIFKC